MSDSSNIKQVERLLRHGCYGVDKAVGSVVDKVWDQAVEQTVHQGNCAVDKKVEIGCAADLNKAEAVLARQVHLPSFLAGLSVEIVAVGAAADRDIVVHRNDEVKVEEENAMAWLIIQMKRLLEHQYWDKLRVPLSVITICGLVVMMKSIAHTIEKCSCIKDSVIFRC